MIFYTNVERESHLIYNFVRTRVSLHGAHVYPYEPPYLFILSFPRELRIRLSFVRPRYPNRAIIGNTRTRAHMRARASENR